jgi:hypothetical protein
MKRLAILVFTLAVLALTTLGVSSRVTFALGHVFLGKHSETDIDDHCKAAGGTPTAGHGTYGCFGPGGDVTCSTDTKTCYGTCTKCSAAARGKGHVRGVQGFLTLAPAGSHLKAGTSKGKVNRSDISITKRMDKASPTLLEKQTGSPGLLGKGPSNFSASSNRLGASSHTTMRPLTNHLMGQ